MKNLLVLWDPRNPLVPAQSVVEALGGISGVEMKAITFDEIGHRTLPNGAAKMHPLPFREEPDGILWIEGGPFPSDLDRFSCPKACWLLNTHLEPSLLRDLGPAFDLVFSASLGDTADERARWLPLTPGGGSPIRLPEGISLLTDDPKTSGQARIERILAAGFRELETGSASLVIALGNGGRVHPMVYDALAAQAAVVIDSDSDLRGIAQAGEHVEVIPPNENLLESLKKMAQDPERLSRVASRGPGIIAHLHEPSIRAAQICEGFWPRHRVLSGAGREPRISVLVTCFRYLRRLKVCLESLARQRVPAGALEIVVADPGSPDGLEDFLKEFGLGHPDLRVVHLPIDPRYHRNRGVGINRAFDASRGRVIVSIDGDIVFPPSLVAALADRVEASPNEVCGVRRVFLPRKATESILAGESDPFLRFDELSKQDGDGEDHAFVGVLGYCQAVHRTAFARARYPEEFDRVNQSDIVFVERLAKWANVRPRFLEDQAVLHLWHPRNWNGTTDFL